MVSAALEIAIRRRMDDMQMRSYDHLDVVQALDEAAKWVQGELSPLRNRTSLSVVQYQNQYTLATTVQKPLEVEYWDVSGGHKVAAANPDDFREVARVVRQKTMPECYTYLESEGVLLFDPYPDTAAHTTTLGADVAAGATSLTVASTTNFPYAGRIIIDSEVISYTYKTSTTLTGCTRAIEGTTAASHSSGATVTERDLLIWGQQRYSDLQMRTYYTAGTIAITVNTTALVGTGTVWTTGAAAGDYFGITSSPTTTMPIRWYKIGTVTDNTNIVLADTYVEPTQTTGTYIISSPNPFPNYCDGLLISYAMSQMLKKANAFDRANLEYRTALNLLANAKQNSLKNDVLMVPQPSTAAMWRGGRMALWARNQRWL